MNTTVILADIGEAALAVRLREIAIGEPFPLPVKHRLESIYCRTLNKSFYVAICKNIGNEHLATAFMSVVSNPTVSAEPFGVIFNLYTIPEHRGNGYALRCVEKIIEQSKTINGISYLEAEVNDISSKIMCRLGFEQISDTPLKVRYKLDAK
jgi:GNAT superfamily N-acetyltransferase